MVEFTSSKHPKSKLVVLHTNHAQVVRSVETTDSLVRGGEIND